MNYNNLFKNSSIFIITVLVAGIGIYPLSSYAQGIGNVVTDIFLASSGDVANIFPCQNVNIVPNINILDVDNTNTNANTATAAAAAANTNEPIQRQNQQDNFEATVNGQQVTPEKILNSLFGNNKGNAAALLEKDIANVCVNNNDNNIIQQQQVAAAAGQNVNVAELNQDAQQTVD